MVRDNLDRTAEQSQKQNHAAVTPSQSRPPEEVAGSEQAKSLERVNPEGQELLHWSKLSLEEEPETLHRVTLNSAASSSSSSSSSSPLVCHSRRINRVLLPPLSLDSFTEAKLYLQVLNAADVESLPTHLRTFSSAAEYKLVKHTFVQLQHSGYYWGSMTMEEAHGILTHAPLGTFLIRDSGQPDVFFTLSYQSDDGPTSVRVQLNNLLFSLYGSHKTFASLFALLKYYTSSSCKLTVPYRKQRPERLKQICRRAVIRTYGAENIGALPGLSIPMKDYVHGYPCSI